jgi:hypothetical protein
MSTSLNIGYWSWNQDRWKYLDEVDYTPNESIAVGAQGKIMTPRSCPGKLYKPTPEHDRYESMYTRNHGEVQGYNSGPHPSAHDAILPARVRGKAKQAVRKQDSLSDAEKSFKLWGRVNPSYCVNPYVTEQQRQFVAPDLMKERFTGETEYPLMVRKKDYQEAMARARNIQKQVEEAGLAPASMSTLTNAPWKM